MESHNREIDVSLDFSIPGTDQGIQSGGMQPAQQPPVAGVTDFSLQAACKQELSHGVYPQFYIKAAENKVMSREAGRPIFEDQEWVMITIRGDRNSKQDRPVTDQDRSRWPGLYTAFKNGQKLAEFGTPLEHWPMMTRSDAENMKYHNVYTVEDLAGLSDQAIQTIGMGARDLVEKAKAFIEKAADSAAPQRMAEEINQLKDQVESLLRNNRELGDAADNAVKTQGELVSLKTQMQELSTRLSDAEARAIDAESRVADLELDLAEAKKDAKVAKRKLTMAEKELDTLNGTIADK